MRPWMELNYVKARRTVYPCQSAGLWFVRSGAATRAFMDGLHEHILEQIEIAMPPADSKPSAAETMM